MYLNNLSDRHITLCQVMRQETNTASEQRIISLSEQKKLIDMQWEEK